MASVNDNDVWQVNIMVTRMLTKLIDLPGLIVLGEVVSCVQSIARVVELDF